jgi:hypothetical protein
MAEIGRELDMFVELVSAYVKQGILTSDDVLGLAEQVMSKVNAIEAPPPAPEPGEACCSFCAKPRSRVRGLVAGPPGIYICNECVRFSSELLAEEERPVARA